MKSQNRSVKAIFLISLTLVFFNVPAHAARYFFSQDLEQGVRATGSFEGNDGGPGEHDQLDGVLQYDIDQTHQEITNWVFNFTGDAVADLDFSNFSIIYAYVYTTNNTASIHVAGDGWNFLIGSGGNSSLGVYKNPDVTREYKSVGAQVLSSTPTVQTPIPAAIYFYQESWAYFGIVGKFNQRF